MIVRKEVLLIFSELLLKIHVGQMWVSSTSCPLCADQEVKLKLSTPAQQPSPLGSQHPCYSAGISTLNSFFSLFYWTTALNRKPEPQRGTSFFPPFFYNKKTKIKVIRSRVTFQEVVSCYSFTAVKVIKHYAMGMLASVVQM